MTMQGLSELSRCISSEIASNTDEDGNSEGGSTASR